MDTVGRIRAAAERLTPKQQHALLRLVPWALDTTQEGSEPDKAAMLEAARLAMAGLSGRDRVAVLRAAEAIAAD
jgi:hypothetical protein